MRAAAPGRRPDGRPGFPQGSGHGDRSDRSVRYAGSALSGVGIGYLVDRAGWRGGFICSVAAALLGGLLALPLWHAGQRYGRKSR